LLCYEENWPVSLPRDDLEMACLQPLIALIQALFTLEDFEGMAKPPKNAV
jgi:CRISPR system Cascade subunit CasA